MAASKNRLATGNGPPQAIPAVPRAPSKSTRTQHLDLINRHSFITWLVLLLPATLARAAEPADRFESFFSAHCFECHDATTKKGKLDLTGLAWNAGDPQIFAHWIEVFDKVAKQEMPPPDKRTFHPAPEEREAFLRGLGDALHTASLAQQKRDGRVVLRRLNRIEYENTIHDLLAILLGNRFSGPGFIEPQGPGLEGVRSFR